MAITVRLAPEHLAAPAGADVDGDILLSNPGRSPVHVSLVLTGTVAGWASISPPELWVPPGQEVGCQLRFRLPRGAPGGTGVIPFSVRVLSDEEGEGGATADGTLDVIGEAELALRLMPENVTGTLSATTRVAVDNLGPMPARAQLEVEPGPSATAEVEPDSLIIDPGSTGFARVHITPSRRLVAGAPRTHQFWVRVEPLGGARISLSGSMTQRSMLIGFLPRAVGVLVVLTIVALLASRFLGERGDDVAATPLPFITTTTSTTTTTAVPTTEAAVAPGTPTTTIPLRERRLAFQTRRDGNFEIYTSAPDGSDPKNLTANPAHDSEPSWSPDHTRIAFDSNREGSFDVFVMNADGTSIQQLTTEPAPDGYPTWSPDGSRIAFISFRDGNSEIYVMNADGTSPQRLTKNLADDAHPVWSPDGQKIAFHSNRDGNVEVYVMNVDGTDPRNISNNPASDQNPAWAPNGARLAFDSTRDGTKPELYVVGADGTLPTRLTTNDDLDTWPTWSPDGGRLAFQSDRDSDLELYVVAVGGGEARRLTTSPGDDAEPDW